jgi:nucleoside-triphosphatase THEP1
VFALLNNQGDVIVLDELGGVELLDDKIFNRVMQLA